MPDATASRRPRLRDLGRKASGTAGASQSKISRFLGAPDQLETRVYDGAANRWTRYANSAAKRCPALTSVHAPGKVRVSLFQARFRIPEIDVPNIASAKKNMRKSRAATVRNRAQRAALRTALKRAKAPSATAEERTNAVSLLDRAARKGLIHRNAAARHKSHLATASAKA